MLPKFRFDALTKQVNFVSSITWSDKSALLLTIVLTFLGYVFSSSCFQINEIYFIRLFGDHPVVTTSSAVLTSLPLNFILFFSHHIGHNHLVNFGSNSERLRTPKKGKFGAVIVMTTWLLQIFLNSKTSFEIFRLIVEVMPVWFACAIAVITSFLLFRVETKVAALWFERDLRKKKLKD